MEAGWIVWLTWRVKQDQFQSVILVIILIHCLSDCIQGHYFIYQIASHFTQIICCNSSQHSDHCSSSLLWGMAHTITFNFLQLILSFYSLYLKVVLEMVVFSLQTRVTFNKCVPWTWKLCWGNWKQYIFLSECLRCFGCCYTVCPSELVIFVR
jgi:hypothetical protein